jgi:outer membrane protein assembly factor BamB
MNRYPATRVFFNPIGDDIVHDGNLFYTLNVSIPSVAGMSIRAVREGEYVIFGSTGYNDERGIDPSRFMALSLVRGEEGRLLWESTLTPPKDGQQWYGPVVFEEVVPEADVCYWSSENLLKYWVYDLKSGQLLWETDTIPEQFSYYGMQEQVYFGEEHNILIVGGTHAGVLRAYDFRTGELLWTAYGEVAGTDSPYGRMLLRGFDVADGKLYTGTSEHSGSSPLWRTEGLHCFDIETGELIWEILSWPSGTEIADGILTYWNMYDGQIYAFGKGPSATTVTASPKVSVHGSSVMIEGTVTDQTPMGRRNVNNVMQFSLKGTPAIADEYMTEWMEYKFMGMGYPADATGVNVTLMVIDPNTNVYDIGTATSDATGAFGFNFEPSVPGTYQIIAAFAGSASYYGSSATTYITVEEAPAETPPPTPPPASVADMYFVPAISGIIVAIVIVGVIIVLMLRKR